MTEGSPASSAWVPRTIIAVVALGVGIAIYSIAVGEGGPQAVEVKGRVEVQKLIAGIRQEGERLGPPDAAVEIDLFTDVRAVPAAEFQREVIDPVIVEYVREGRAQINLRHFSFGRTAVTEPALGAHVAGEQGHQWQYAELVLRNLSSAGPAGTDEEFLERIASVTPGLEKDEWDDAFAEELGAQLEDPGYESPVDQDGRLAFDLKLPAEPAVIVTGPGGSETLPPTPALAEIRAAIERVEVPAS
ncbi:MAG: DsbA family protein [Actinomycetota bacterium]|nr:DsbA family protein [Actinomycetota bacterium]